MDLSFATATELAAALRAGELSSVELLDHVLARIDEVNPPLNAVVLTDPERARRDAAGGRCGLRSRRRRSGRCTEWS